MAGWARSQEHHSGPLHHGGPLHSGVSQSTRATLLLPSCMCYQRTGSEVEQLWSESVLWYGMPSIAGDGSAWYARISVLPRPHPQFTDRRGSGFQSWAIDSSGKGHFLEGNLLSCLFHWLVFQFDCTNTLNDQLLEKVTVQMEPSDSCEVLCCIPASSLTYNHPGICYTLVRLPEDDPTAGTNPRREEILTWVLVLNPYNE